MRKNQTEENTKNLINKGDKIRGSGSIIEDNKPFIKNNKNG